MGRSFQTLRRKLRRASAAVKLHNKPFYTPRAYVVDVYNPSMKADFGDRARFNFSCTVLGYIPGAEAMLVRSIKDGVYSLRALSSIKGSSWSWMCSKLDLTSGSDGSHFKYRIWQNVNAWVCDVDNVYRNEYFSIEHRIRDADTGVCWYVVRLQWTTPRRYVVKTEAEIEKSYWE